MDDEGAISQALAEVIAALEACDKEDEDSLVATWQATNAAMELMHSQYALRMEFYGVWVRLCVEIAPSNKEGFLTVFDLVLKDCPTFQLVATCIDHLINLHEEEAILNDQVREYFEAAIRACGSDLFSGAILWDKYVSFEIDEHEDLIEQESDPQLIQQSKERLVRLFHRALSLPLINNEALLSKCNEAFEGFFTESDISIIKPELLADKVAKSRKGLELRAPLELPIISIAQQMEERGELSPQQEEELIRLFHEYIAFETKQKEYSRVQRLYERAVLLVPSAILYVEFSLFLLVTVKQNALALSWLLKGYRRHRRCLVLHRLLIVAWEATNTPLDDLSTHYRTTIGSGLNSADDYLYFFMLVANSYCRRAFHCHGSEEERTAASDALTQLFEDVQTFLTTYFPDWLDGWYRWTKVRAEIDWKRHQQAQLITADATRRVGKAAARSPAWERLASISPGQWWIWQEAISFYASHQELEAARGLFRKVLHLSLDVSSVAVGEAFLAFEDLYGDLSTMLAALERVQNTLPAAAIAVAPSAEPTEATIATGEGAGASEQWPAAHADSALSSGEKKHRSKPVHQERAQKPLPKRKRPVESIEAPVSANSPASPQAPANTEPVPEERMPKKPRTSNNDESDGLAAAPSAILVQNLPFAAPFEAIRSFLLDCLAMQGVAAEQVSLEPLLSKAGHPRGVVRICFREASHLPRALALHGQSFQGRPVRVDLDTSYTPTPAAAPTSAPANAAPPTMEAAAATGGVASAATTVFVTGLAEETAEHDLAAFFEGCGPIAAIKVIVDKKTNTPKGSALVQFETIKARDRALQLSKQTLLNKQVMVNKSRFGIKPIAPENVGTAGQTDGQQIEAAQRHSASSVEASAPVDVHPVATAPDAPTSAAPTPVHATKPPPPSKERMAMFKPRSMRTKLQL